LPGYRNSPHWGGNPDCGSATQLDILNSDLHVNNLGGKGPSGVTEQSMTYKSVASLRDAGTGQVSAVNLVVKSLTPYSPADSSRNGKFEEFGMISVGAGTSVNVEFRFQDNDGNDITMPNIIFTVFGMTSSKGQKYTKKVTTCEASKYFRSDRSTVYAAEDFPEDGCVSFVSVDESNSDAAPIHPQELTETQRNEAVSLQFKNTPAILLTFEVSGQDAGPFTQELDASDHHDGLTFSFAGQSNVASCHKY